MSRALLSVLAALLLAACGTTPAARPSAAAGTPPPAAAPAGAGADARPARAAAPSADRADDPFVEDLLARMTLEEKLGQLTQFRGRWGDTGPRV